MYQVKIFFAPHHPILSDLAKVLKETLNMFTKQPLVMHYTSI